MVFPDLAGAVCDYYLSGGDLARQSRRIYDRHRLAEAVELDGPLADLVSTVRKQRAGRFGCPSAEEGASLGAIFTGIADDGACRTDCESVPSRLLHDTAIAVLLPIAAFLADSR